MMRTEYRIVIIRPKPTHDDTMVTFRTLLSNIMAIYYIILRDSLILSKEIYTDWREIQDKYPDSYMASLGPWGKGDLVSYFMDDYGDGAEWPFSPEEIDRFFLSEAITLVKYR